MQLVDLRSLRSYRANLHLTLWPKLYELRELEAVVLILVIL